MKQRLYQGMDRPHRGPGRVRRPEIMIGPMSREPSRLRLFVAIYPPPPVAERLLEAVRRLPLPPHRPVPAAQVHLTVHFIGDCPAGDLPRTLESVELAGAGLRGFTLTPTRLVTLPTRGPRRLIAAASEAPATLEEIKRRLVTRLARRPSHRPFLPHLTLARFRSPVSLGAGDLEIGLDESSHGPLGFDVDHLKLMKSDLRPEGAVHREVATVPLA